MAFIGMEWIVAIVAIVLFLFGAKKIPEFARGLGKASGEFRRGKMMVEKEMLSMDKDLAGGSGSRPTSTGDGEVSPSLDRHDGPSPIRDAARELGIATDGRSEAELKELIKARVTGEGS